MTAAELLLELTRAGVTLRADGEQLRYEAPAGVMTQARRAVLRDRKEEILALLREPLPQAEPADLPIVRVPRDQPLPLSFAQRRVWLMSRLRPDSGFYNVPVTLALTGPLDRAALQRSLDGLIRRHESLRTAIVADDTNVPWQVIKPAEPTPLEFADVSDLPAAERSAEAQRLAAAAAVRPFDLSSGRVMRALLVCIDSCMHLLVLAIHHVAIDIWSLRILLRDLRELYASITENRSAELPALPVQYADFAAWQRQHLTDAALAAGLAYWRERLAELPMTELPTDRSRPAARSFQGASESIVLEAALSDALRAASGVHRASLFTVLFAAFQVLVGRYANSDDVVTGIPTASRTHAEVEDLIGFFVNSLPIRTDLSSDPTFAEVLGRVRENLNGAFAHETVPFERLVQELGDEVDPRRNPLFQIMFTLHGGDFGPLRTGDLALQPQWTETFISRFDVEIQAFEDGGRIRIVAIYDTDLFDAQTIRRLLRHYERTLAAMAASPQARISELQLLDATERGQILVQWNDTSTAYPADRCIHELLEEQARRAPDAVAAAYDGRELSYGELAARANRLARYLLRHGVGPETRVGLCLERGLDMVVATLAILKAGGAYVPLDPEYPASRLAFMLADSDAPVLVTDSKLRERLPQFAGRLLCLDEEWNRIALEDASAPNVALHARNLAYVIYTSGSTGEPKGTCVEHRSVVRLVRNTDYIEIEASDRIAQASVVSFDAATFEIWGALLNGACVVGVPRPVSLDPQAFAAFLREHGVTVLFLTTALFNQMAREAPGVFGCLRYMLFGGEAVDAGAVRAVLRDGPPGHLLHVYGPTEVTTFSTWHRVRALGETTTTVPIGRPIANTTAYVLDRQRQPVPVGVPGELYLGGDGLARGYLNRPELTAERFVAHPFDAHAGARLYRTGDLVRWSPDGAIEFLGRIDNQIKLRGFRIELGEIEAALMQQAAVRDAVVVMREDSPGDKRLVAYVVPDWTRADAGAAGKDGEWESQHQADWLSMYEETYGHGSDDADPTFDLSGWNSSYTGEAIPRSEMREWVDATVERIRTLSPQRVLEIGCGTGLLLSRIAPETACYVGTDFSPVALAGIAAARSKVKGLEHVTLWERMADDFSGIEPGSFDTVIVNSVSQYLPSIRYMTRVVEGAVRAVRPGGHVFVGDVRNRALLDAFHTAIETHRSPPTRSVTEWSDRAQQAAAAEDELVIDPEYFLTLPLALPAVRHVEVLHKQGRARNELTQFRYDVVIHVDRADERPPAEPAIQRVPWGTAAPSLEALKARLEQGAAPLVVTDVPNARVSQALRQLALRREPAGAATVAEIRARTGAEHGVDPADMWTLGAALGRRVEVSLAESGDAGRFDALFGPACAGGGRLVFPTRLAGRSRRPLHSYATDPLRGQRTSAFVPRLRDALAARLPEFMLPSAFVLLDALPLNKNGKVDRRALPAPAGRGQLRVAYEAPASELERTLAGIWQQVLRVEQVGRHDDFFELGGHSLLAMQVVSRVRQALGVELPLSELFRNRTVEASARWIDARNDSAENRAAVAPIRPVPRDRDAVLSFAQERLWFVDQLAPGSAAYNMPLALRLEGALDRHALERSLNVLVQRHETLRTRFESVDGKPRQLIEAQSEICLRVIDLSGWAGPARTAEASLRIREEAFAPFDLSTGPLVRATLLVLAEHDHVLLLTLHHICSDGWSLEILFRELGTVYGAILRGEAPVLAPLPIQYADYAAWQRDWLREEDLDRQREYWKDCLAGLSTLALPLDRPRPPVPTYRGAVRTLRLPGQLTRALESLSQREGTTLFMTLLAGFYVLLRRYSGQDDIVIGSPIANRDRREVEGLIGFFVNVLALRIDLSGDPTFRALLQRVRAMALGAYAHQDLPFEKLVEALRPERDLSRNPLFQVAFAMTPAPLDAVSLPGLTLARAPIEALSTRFDLEAQVWQSAEGLELLFIYSEDLFEAATIERMLGHYERVLSAVTQNPEARICEHAMLTEAERRRVLEQWNATDRDYGEPRPLHRLIEAQVRRTPQAVALEYEGRTLTYAEVDARANRLARALRARGVGPDVLVGICAERSFEMVLALLAVLKAGGAYVPLDPEFPPQRLGHILADAQVALVLAQAHLADRLPAGAPGVLPLDESWAAYAEHSAEDLAVDGSASDLAYVIFTSGSTGRPKGAMNEHAGICNRLLWMQEQYGLQAADAVLQKTPFSFDVSVWEFFWPLLTGARLVIARPGGHRDSGYLAQIVRERAITTLHFVPSLLRVFLEEDGVERCNSLKRVICSGEALGRDLQERFHARLPGVELHNLYGPTEAAVDVTYWACRPGDPRPTVPIGRPVANTRMYVLDEHMHPLPEGVPGELYIGGVQVGRGYVGRPDLTAERFVPDPFSAKPGARLYRTGDRARWTAEGLIEYLGRLDYQVKIRGQRIELGEIEASLDQHPDVRQSVVLACEEAGADQRLVAYVVAARESTSAAELKAYLARSLPPYMVPGAYVFLPQLPLTASGKVDRKALPAPPRPGADGAPHYAAPRTPTEEIVANLWASVLQLERVGVHDDFFELGGHSLLATQVVSRARQLFGLELPLRDLFESSVLADFAARIDSLRARSRPGLSAPALEPGAQSGPAELSFAQQRLWLLEQIAPQTAAYVIAGALELRGILDVAVLEDALASIVDRHEALRTLFVEVEGEPQQVVTARGDWTMGLVDLSAEPAAHDRLQALLRTEAARGFDLGREPLFRARLYRLSAERHVLLLTMHHIVSDGWSLGVITRELAVLYRARIGSEDSALPRLGINYRDYARWQRQWLQGEVLQQELAHWRGRLAGAPQTLELPVDRPRPTLETHRGAFHRFELPRDLTRGLYELSRQAGATLFMTLLSGFALLLARYSGQNDFLIGSPVANRNRSEVEDLVGFFANTLVLRADLSGEPSVRELVARMREVCLDAYAHQDLPFERLVEELRPVRDLSRNPLVQVVFALQNAPQAAPDLPGLQVSAFALDYTAAQFDLSLIAWERPDGLAAAFSYATDLFDAATIARLAGHWHGLLEQMVADPDRPIGDLDPLSAAERRWLLEELNATAAPYPAGSTIAGQFAMQARSRPQAIALAYGTDVLSYGELDARANALALRLRQLGVDRNVPVGVLMERSAQMVVAWLAALKAGGAYVPLDPAYPAQRLRFMLSDSGAPVLLTQSSLRERVPGYAGGIVCVDEDELQATPGMDPQALAALGGGEDLAYIVYTSGSTGEPKGVAVPQRAVLRLVCNTDYVQLEPGDCVVQASNASFDAATFEVWGALLNGARLEGASRETVLSPAAFGDFLHARGASVLFVTTALFNQMVREAPGCFSGLRALLFGGEAVDVQAVRALLAHGRPGRLLHVYGPTECTTFASWYEVREVAEQARTVPIGGPIRNTTLYVLDERRRLVPVGVTGELYVGGAGLALGYLGREALSAERFVADPFGTPGERLYRTGDLVRRLADGSIEFIGRADTQVKLRGFRIELGEIEAALRAEPGVGEAVVLCREDRPGQRQLVAYVTAAAESVSPSRLRARLREKLPEYMLPGAFVVLAKLPLTPNGKVDKSALPAPEGASAEGDAGPAPRSAREKQIAAVFSEVLQVDEIGVRSNFFDLGGHSLLLVKLHKKLQALFDADLSLVELFEYPTVEALARRLGGGERETRRFGGVQARIERRKQRTGAYEPIAIVGMAGRFPGAPSPEAMWRNICAGVEAVSALSDDELRAAGVSEALLERPGYVKAGVVLEDVELFDPALFGYTPREAQLLDPQQRMFLQCAWEALEHAGYDPARYPGAIGVFAGVGQSTYPGLLAADPALAELLQRVEGTLALDKDFVATRVSYKLGLSGPSLTVQTACSTSLVAVHVAARSLQEYECDMALAGGVSITLPQKTGYLYEPGGINSPDGHCRAFDADAAGTVGGSGAALVVLKRLEDALADGDTIHAVIKGSAINNDGAGKVGFTAPSVEGQAAVIAAAQAEAGVDADSIGYVEAHGTGTRLGDPVEVAALSQVFRASTQRVGFCALGSIKTNMGHLNTAAGCAGLVKAALAVRDGVLPPSLHYRAPNPEIDFASTPFFVNTALAPWSEALRPRRAGVSSFGIGGTNAHVIVEEAPARERSAPSSRRWQLLVLSAKTEAALDSAAQRLAAHLEANCDAPIADVAYTLQVGRRELDWRAVALCRDAAEAREALRGSGAQSLRRGRIAKEVRPVAFMFTGQGSQYPGMAAALYREDALYRKNVDACCEILARRADLDLKAVLFPADPHDDRAAQRLRDTRYAQPALFVTEYALARRWIDWGIRPDAMIGHSIGEYVAACLAEVMSLEDALVLVATRGRLIGELPGGSMLAVPLPESELEPLLDDTLEIAAVNGPRLCVVSGAHGDVERLHDALRARGQECVPLHTSHAFHSKWMDPAIGQLERCVSQLTLAAPKLPYISNVTGDWATEAQATDPRYWADHLRKTVRFGAGVERLLEDDARLLLEVGPGSTLAGIVRQQFAAKAAGRVCRSLRGARESGDDERHLLDALGTLWLAGAAVDWHAFSSAERRRRVPLPTYAFDRQRCWPAQGKRLGGADDAPRRSALEDWFYTATWVRSVLTPASAQAGAARGPYLLFMDRRGVGEQLARMLQARGETVVQVRAGREYQAAQPGSSYLLAPAAPADYAALLGDLDACGRWPRQVVHLWGLEAVRREAQQAAQSRCQDLGFYSLLCLAQALGSGDAPIAISVVTEGAHAVTGAEPLQPEKALVVGPCRVIPEELPNASCRNLDVIVPKDRGDGLAATVLSELDSASAEAIVAYRNGERWTEAFEPLRLPSRDGVPGRLRQGGVYLITGGLGGIGLAVAGYLARAVQARLVLVGRSSLPAREAWDEWLAAHGDDDAASRRIRAVKRLEADGAEVMVASADAADEPAMQAVIALARARFGRIHGLVHAAGVGGGGVIQLKSRADAAGVLAPKVEGTRILERALAGEALDFVVLCSSLTAVLGGASRLEYCAANAFLDAVPAYWRQGRGPATVAIDWDTWKDVGMAAAATLPGNLAAHHEQALRLGMTAEEGVEAFRRILAAEPALPRVLVSTRSLGSRLPRREERTPPASETQPQIEAAGTQESRRPPHLSQPYAAARNATEAQLAGIWQELIGFEPIGIDDDFFELGGHSLLAIQLVGRINAAFGVKLTLQELYANPTVGKLAERLGALRIQHEPRYDELAELVSNLDRYSEDDIRRIVAESRAAGPGA